MKNNRTINTIRRSMKLVAVGSSVLLASCGDKHRAPTVKTHEHAGHQYLIFAEPGNYGQTYVHDPECQCGKSR